MEIEITEMQFVTAVLFDAKASGLTLDDVCEAARYSDCLMCFDEAVSLLGIGAIEVDTAHGRPDRP